MDEIAKIKTKKGYIAEELHTWALTFIGELDDDGEETLEAYDYVFELAERLKNNQCSEEDYEDVLFHIWQINHNEEKVIL